MLSLAEDLGGLQNLGYKSSLGVDLFFEGRSMEDLTDGFAEGLIDVRVIVF